MGPALQALAAICLISAESPEPRMGIFVLEAPDGVDRALIAAEAADVFEGSGRFLVAEVPDTLPAVGQGENLIAGIQSLASEYDLDVVLTFVVREPEVEEATIYSGDSVVVTSRASLTVGGRFYSSAGELLGSLDEFRAEDFPAYIDPDLSGIAAAAARELASRSLLTLFPVEIWFTAGEGDLVELPIGTSSGLKDGMFLFCVASASEIPVDPEQYGLLRSRGLLQIIECGPSSATGRLLSGGLASGGPVTAVEHGTPAFLAAGWDLLPVTLEPGSVQGEGFDENQVMNGVRIGLSNFRWGLCLGGALSASTIDEVSAIQVSLRGGFRIPLSGPVLSIRLTGGPDLTLLMQDVTVPYLASDASAVTFGGSVESTLEFLLGEHFGLTLGASGILSSEADSWTVQESDGNSREGAPSELYYTSLSQDAFRAGAGFFYLIY
jgi:hypothetical protein